MPVINGVYTKDFPALGRAPIDTDIIPIAELANQITYKTTLGELFNAKVFGTTGRLSKFTSANTLGNSILNEIGNAIHLTNAGSSYASFGIINPGTPGEPGIDNDAYIGSTINNDFTIRVNNVEAARFDTALRFKITTIQNATTDTDKFLVSDGGVVKYRTGTEVLADIGGASASGFVPYTGATSNVNLGAFNITASSLIKAGGVDTQFLKADGSVDNNNYLTANDLPSTLSLYATNVAAAVAGYFKLVTTIDDPDYNTIAVDVPTGAITTTDQLIASLVSPVNLINGNPGVFNVTTTGNITRISGSGEAEFFFRIYKRDSGGVETLIGTSGNTIPVINSGYSEFFATAIWNDGVFGVTDSIVLKYYATRLAGGSNPTYQFQFGGDQPVRTIVPIPTAVIPNIFLEELADVEDGVASNNDGIFFDSSVSLWKYKSVAEVLGYTPANDASVVHLDGTETITGRKTFNNVNGLTIDEVSGALVPTKIFSSNIQTLNYAVSNTSNNFLGTFLGTVTANRTYSIPDISGTLALTSNITSAISGTTNYIPKFTGANTIGNSSLQTDTSGNLGLGVTPSAWGGSYKAIQIGGTSALWNLLDTTGLSNNLYNDGSFKYIQTKAATNYFQTQGEHQWFNAPIGTAGNAITFTQAMTLNASGNLGLGVTPSAWVGAKAISVGGAGSYYADGLTYGWQTGMVANAYRTGSTTWAYQNSGIVATRVEMSEINPFTIFTAPSGTAGNAITFTQAMTLGANGILSLPSSGSLEIGYTSSPSLYKLDVNGTVRVAGALIAQSNIDLTGDLRFQSNVGYGIKSQNGSRLVEIYNGLFAVTGAATFSSSVSVNGSAIGRANAIRINGANLASTSNSYNAFISTNTTQAIDIGGSLGLGGEVGGDNAAFAVISGRKENSTSGNYSGYFAISTIDGGASMTEKMRITSGGNVLIGTTDNPGVKLNVNGDIKTSAPSGGTAKPFKVGAAATYGGAATFDRTIEIEIDGTTYYLAAKTTST